MRTVALSVALALSLVACGTVPPIPPPQPAPIATCADACANLERLGCEAGKPQAVARANCTVVCEHMLESGQFLLQVDCIAAAASAEAVMACGERCRQ